MHDFHRPHAGFVVRLDDVDDFAAQTLHDGRLRYEDRVLQRLHRELHADKRAGPKLLLLVVEHRLYAHGTRGRVHSVVDDTSLPLKYRGLRAGSPSRCRACPQSLQGILQVALGQR